MLLRRLRIPNAGRPGMRNAHLSFASCRGVSSSSLTDRELILAMRGDIQMLRSEFKSDMQKLNSEIKSDMQNLLSEFGSDMHSDMQNLRFGIRSDIQNLGSELGSNMQKLGSDIRSDMQNLRSEINRDMEVLLNNWFRRNEIVIYASLVVGVVAMFCANAVHTQHLKESHRIELLARDSASESRTRATIMSGAMSGDVFTENAKRAAKGL